MPIVENTKTVRRFREAISVQDACNPSGIAHSMVEHYENMLDAGASTYELQNDNAMSLFAMKLLDLAGVPYDTGTYNSRLKFCKKQIIYFLSNPPVTPLESGYPYESNSTPHAKFMDVIR